LGSRLRKIVRKPYIPMLKENNVRPGFFERGDFISLRDAVDYLKPVVTFAYIRAGGNRRSSNEPGLKSICTHGQ
jgi:hypothetical protein